MFETGIPKENASTNPALNRAAWLPAQEILQRLLAVGTTNSTSALEYRSLAGCSMAHSPSATAGDVLRVRGGQS